MHALFVLKKGRPLSQAERDYLRRGGSIQTAPIVTAAKGGLYACSKEADQLLPERDDKLSSDCTKLCKAVAAPAALAALAKVQVPEGVPCERAVLVGCPVAGSRIKSEK